MVPAPFDGDTHFLPAGRVDEAELRVQVEACVESPVAQAILESLDGYVVILNDQRQILAANPTLLEALRAEGLVDPLGMRWGEAAHCVHAQEGPDGCGTSRACRYCGAALALLAAQEGQSPVSSECRMSIRKEGRWEAREFQLRATSLRLPLGRVLIPVFHDISDQHRREMLETAFLHDLGNTLSALSCWADLLKEGDVDLASAAARIVDLSGRLSDAVNHQRLLVQAERGEVPVDLQPVEADPFLASLQESLAPHPMVRSKGLHLRLRGLRGARITTDPVLLLRVLSNMAVNAVEAAGPGETVTLAFALDGTAPAFSVHNPGCMSEAVAAQVFQRSFSTKAQAGRGLGTYAMKLLGENLLGGRVGFTSTPEDGTTFTISLPAPGSGAPAGR
ncbi:sensor histidine kinase [Mesoterricola sediminis]|uniref:histidine kinase n=1 Tax=Mesoterricola sediminis TaxID=2927980 RepID=A0AA48H6A7_9BACT|nr:HAMP domain-containing sensor histidine kinase [Mesoterricola sediminis]BDU78166.1 sensor histidine kinase [Mesoterricola sediminis]